MNKIQQLWKKDFIRFLFVGGVNSMLGFIYYSVLLQFMSYGYALTVGYIVGIVTSYLLNSWIVFRVSPTWHKFLQFPIIYLIQYVVNLGVTAIGVEFFGIDERLAFIIVIVFVVPLTYTISRLIIVTK